MIIIDVLADDFTPSRLGRIGRGADDRGKGGIAVKAL